MSMTRTVSIITGGASGIGRALADQLARRGHQVVLSDIDGDAARAVADAINTRGGAARAEAVDVRDADVMEQLIRGTRDEYGRIDYMFNNAGIVIGGEVRDFSLDDWRRTLDIDLRGVVHGVIPAYEIMVEQGFGHMVNIGSVAGLVPTPGLTAYAAAKHGVVGLSLSLRAEAKLHGVRVSVVCPGLIDTPMMRGSELRNFDRGAINERLKSAGMPPERCAHLILRGVDRNRPIIVITGHGHVAYHTFRLQPRLYFRLLEFGLQSVVRRLRRS